MMDTNKISKDKNLNKTDKREQWFSKYNLKNKSIERRK